MEDPPVTEPALDHPRSSRAAELYDWWTEQAASDAEVAASKADEYGSYDLLLLGKVLADMTGFPLVDGESPEETYAELGICFYALGKVARWVGAVVEGRRPSADTLRDLKVYTTMVERVRAVGGWPWEPEQQRGGVLAQTSDDSPDDGLVHVRPGDGSAMAGLLAAFSSVGAGFRRAQQERQGQRGAATSSPGDAAVSTETIQQAVELLLEQLKENGWTRYKASELIDPTKQWTVRTGYSGGEAYIQINRFSQEAADRHIAELDPYQQVGHRLRLHPRMEQSPEAAIQELITAAGVPL
jgi:hypothetical protein